MLLLALLLLLVLRRSGVALEAHFEVGRSFALCEALILTAGRVAFCFSPQVLCSPSSLIPGSPAYVVLHAIVSETPPRAGAWPWSLLRSHAGVLASATQELLRRAAYPFCLVDGGVHSESCVGMPRDAVQLAPLVQEQVLTRVAPLPGEGCKRRSLKNRSGVR